MIRLAEKTDQEQVVKLIIQFAKASTIRAYNKAQYHEDYMQRIYLAILENGKIWVAEQGGEIVGVLACLIEQDIWDITIARMREILWYVKPEYRDTTVGGRLFATYCKYAQALLDEGKITGYSVSMLANSPSIDLANRGWRAVETHWIKEA